VSVEGISDEDIHHTRFWLTEFGRDARGDVPLKLHTREPGGLGAAPPFTDAFVGYIGQLSCNVDNCGVCANEKRAPREVIESERAKLARRLSTGNRTSRALRRLRKVAPLEYDVLNLVIMHGLSADQIADRLNERSTRRGFDETHSVETVTLLVVSGTDKMSTYF
jgi:hypothetical protein